MTNEQIIDLFNRAYPVGTTVRYWPGVKRGEGTKSRTISKASDMHGTPVVWIEGCTSCVARTHVDLEEDELC